MKRYGHINRIESSLAGSNVGQQDITKTPKISTRTMHCDRYIQKVYAKQIRIPLRNLVRRSGYSEGYDLDGPEFESLSKQGIFFPTNCPERIRCPPRLIFSGYRGSSQGVNGRSVKLTLHLPLVPRLRKSGVIQYNSNYPDAGYPDRLSTSGKFVENFKRTTWP